MQFQFTFRHLDVSPALREYSEEQFLKCSKLLLKDSRFQVEFSSGRHDCQVSVLVNGPWGVFKARAESDDFYAAVDLAAEKLSKQFQKCKEQLQHHKNFDKSREGQLEHVNSKLEFEKPPGLKKGA